MSNNLAVLYVEDEPLARWTGVKMIEPLVGRLVSSASCAEAESFWQQDKFDLVITDYRLDDCLATDMVDRMRAAGHETPVVCLSGESDDLQAEQKNAPERFMKILSKPLDVKMLANILSELSSASQPDELGASEPRCVESAPAVSKGVLPLWVAPAWELISAASNPPPYFELAPGRKEGLWILLYDCMTGYAGEMRAAERIGLMFRQLADWIPAAAGAERMLSRCRAGLQKVAEPDYDWVLSVIHLRDGRMTCVREADNRAWHVWLDEPGNGWRLLTDWSDGARPVAVNGLLAMDFTCCEAVLAKRADVNLAGAGAELASVVAAPTARDLPGNRFYLSGRAPARRLIFTAGQLHDNPGDVLVRLEFSLLTDGLPPAAVRRLCCGILDVYALPAFNELTVEWDAERLSIIMAGAEHSTRLADNRFFDSVAGSDGVTRAAIAVRNENDGMPGNSQGVRRPNQNAGTPPPRFEVTVLPVTLMESIASELRDRLSYVDRLVLDARQLRFFSHGALLVLREMAARRRTGKSGMDNGVLCLLGCSPLIERLVRLTGMDRDIDLAADFTALAAMAGRLTSFSERAAILESVVKW